MSEQRQSMWNSIAGLAVLAVLTQSIALEAVSAGTVTGTVQCRARNNGNAVIWLESSTLPEPKPPDKPVVLDQLKLRFVPHVLPVLVGTTVAFPNSDEVRHNVFSSSRTKRFNLGTYSVGVTRDVTFDKAGEVALLCNVHSEMSAYVVVLETPYFAVSDRAGSFMIRNVPAGEYTVMTWHERLRPVTAEVTIQGDEMVSLELRLNRRR